MSSNLVWYPIITSKEYDLPNELKFVLRKRYGDPINEEMDASEIPYLDGLIDAGVKGADKLKEVIEKHGMITLKEVF